MQKGLAVGISGLEFATVCYCLPKFLRLFESAFPLYFPINPYNSILSTTQISKDFETQAKQKLIFIIHYYQQN